MDADTLRQREDALRRKEKEVIKREEHVQEQTEQLRHMRASMEAQIQELEARELVMNDAEVKHGSLLQREELLSRRLREVAEREESLKERLLEAGRRETEMHEKIKAKQREYDQKLFPLAAREQELFRREQEAKALEADLDSRLKAFNKRVVIEEEKDRAKEKSLRELEAKAKELLALAEKKQTEADQFSLHLNEKQRLVKAEQVEVDSRDREVKWRDEQLRVSLIEHNEFKLKMANWEKALSMKEEELNVATAAFELQKAEVGVKELTVAERLTRLLDAEKDLQERELKANETLRNADDIVSSAAARASAVQEREKTITDQSLDLTKLSCQLRDFEKRLKSEEEDLQRRRRSQDEKEKAIKEWILELQYREQTLADQAASSANNHSSGDVANSTPTTNFTSGIVKMQLDDVQSAYMGAVSKRSHNAAAKKEALRRPVDIGSLEPDTFDKNLRTAASLCEMESNARRIEKVFADLSTRYYCVQDEKKDEMFSQSEQTQITGILTEVAKQADELQFLSIVLLGGMKAPSSAAKLANSLAAFGEDFSVGQWMDYYNVVRESTTARKSTVIACRAAAMQDFVELVSSKSAAFPEDFGPRQDRKDVLGAPPVGRIRNRDISKTLPLGRAKPAPQKQQAQRAHDDAQQSADDHQVSSDEDGEPADSAQQPVAPASMAPVLVSPHERERLIAALPSYLRKHYQ